MLEMAQFIRTSMPSEMNVIAYFTFHHIRSSAITMPKQDPLPPSPLSSPYSPVHDPVASTCWGKAVGSLRNRRSYHMGPQDRMCQLVGKGEPLYYDETSPYYKGLVDGSLVLKLPACNSPGRDSHYTATTTSSKGSSRRRMWGGSCFQSRESEFSPIGIKAETSLINDKKKKRQDVDVVKDEPSSSEQSLKEKARPAAEKIPTRIISKKDDCTEGRKYIWADKYRPNTLSNFICHQAKAYVLQQLVNSGQCDHFIFEGPPGVGKRTMARALVREVCGTQMLETEEALKDFNVEGGQNSVQINVEISSHHTEVNLSRLDKHLAASVVVELIKDSLGVTLSQKQLQCDNKNNVRAIIIVGAEKLSDDAQLRIRNHLDTCRSHLKIYFCYSGTSMLQNLKSHCTVMQIPTPFKEEIVEVLQFVAEREEIELPDQLARNIAEMSKHSVRHAIRSLEATWKLNYPFKEDQDPATGWEEELAEIAKKAIEEQSLEQSYIINQKIKRLKVHNVPAEIIFKTFVGELKKLLDDELLLKICDFCKNKGYYDLQNLTNENTLSGGKTVIEEFVAKFMSAYKKITQNQASD